VTCHRFCPQRLDAALRRWIRLSKSCDRSQRPKRWQVTALQREARPYSFSEQVI